MNEQDEASIDIMERVTHSCGEPIRLHGFVEDCEKKYCPIGTVRPNSIFTDSTSTSVKEVELRYENVHVVF